MTPRLTREAMVLIVALASLLSAVTGWVKADTERKEKQALADNYGSYIRDQMVAEEDQAAMERALGRCMGMLREAQR